MILAIIIACEIGFWVAIAAGLAARYLLRKPRLGVVLLALAPLIDLVLLIATGLHLRGGAEASFEHGLAAIYIGFSVSYGHRLISWADVRFAHRFTGGPPPVRLSGWAYTRKCWADVARTLLGTAVAAGVVFGLTWWVDDAVRTAALQDVYRILLIVLAIDLIWAVSYTLWPKRPSHADARTDGIADTRNPANNNAAR